MYEDEVPKALTQAVAKLQAKLERLERQLLVEENRARGWNPRKCTKLRDEITRVDKQIELALNLLERSP